MNEQKQIVLNMAAKGIRIDQIHYYTGISITEIKNICNQNYMDNKKINEARTRRPKINKKAISRGERESGIQYDNAAYQTKSRKPRSSNQISQDLKKIRKLI